MAPALPSGHRQRVGRDVGGDDAIEVAFRGERQGNRARARAEVDHGTGLRHSASTRSTSTSVSGLGIKTRSSTWSVRFRNAARPTA